MSTEYFKWDQQYQLDVTKMDDEHKMLIKLMNDIHTSNVEKKPFSFIIGKLDELVKLTEMHFKHEEDYFSSLPYAKTEIHKTIHRDLIAKLKTHATTIRQQQNIPESFFTFLKVWLSAHIMGIDTGYAKVSKTGSKSA